MTVGLVLSIFSVTDAVAVLLAPSVAVLETSWLAPSVVVVTGAGQVTGVMPPAQVKVVVTFVLFQPAGLGDGLGVAEMVNVVPRVTVRLVVVVFPATSLAWIAIELGPWARVRGQEKLLPLRVAVALLQVTFARPESASVAVPVRVI